MVTAGAILEAHGNRSIGVIGWFLLCLGVPMLAMSLVLIFVQSEEGSEKIFSLSFFLQFLLFPLLLPSVPIIFLVTKLLSVFKPKNKFIQSQATIGSRGEAILEASPQFVLQCYVVFITLTPTWVQLLSIATSALTLSLPNIEHHVTARSEEFCPKSILKNIAVFLPASLFKILSVSILCVFLNYLFIVSVFINICNVALAVFLRMAHFVYKLADEKDCERRQQFWESFFLSWLTITNLGQGKSAAVFRLVTTLYWTIAHTITLTLLLVFCNTDPGIGVIDTSDGHYIDWPTLALVQDISTLNILLISTICVGWFSLVLDITTAAVKKQSCRSCPIDQQDKTVFWDGAILLEGMKY